MSVSAQSTISRRRLTLRLPRYLRTGRGKVGASMLLLVLAVAVLGPLVAPHTLVEPIGVSGSAPSKDALLGTDFLGRDVLSRLLHGGLPVLWVAVVAVLATYIVGISIGMVAALSRSWLDTVLMRGVDVFIVIPSLLVILVLMAGAGSSTPVLLIGIVIALTPGVTRIVRSATLEVSTLSYVEAAVARGERTSAVMRREILPNIVRLIIADAGIRFLTAIFIVASLSFLGLGAQPPAANWGLMIAENRSIIPTNIWAVLAPAIMLGLLAISVNLVGEAYVDTLERSSDPRNKRRVRGGGGLG